jgi:hypothetical protein
VAGVLSYTRLTRLDGSLGFGDRDHQRHGVHWGPNESVAAAATRLYEYFHEPPPDRFAMVGCLNAEVANQRAVSHLSLLQETDL